jgi:quercetin dioxygenase-like cupin family protein
MPGNREPDHTRADNDHIASSPVNAARESSFPHLVEYTVGRKVTMSSTPRAVSATPSSLAESLRALRLSRRLSLADVAAATQISPSFLSLVEKGKSDITIGRLVRLVEFYGVALADLVPTNTQPSFPEVLRKKDRRLVHSPAEGIDVFLLTPDTRRHMMPMVLHFDPGAGLAEHGRHPGEEWVHVLEGQLSLEIEGANPVVLEEGDSAYYPAERPHLFRNPDDTRRLRLICVDTPPNL